MKALTILQPWATCIARHGKDVENRTWAPHRYQLASGDLLAIHAAKRPFTKADRDFVLKNRTAGRHIRPEWIEPEALPLGAVIAVVTYEGIWGQVCGSQSPWAAPGFKHWGLCHPRALEIPVFCRGRQGLWELPSDVETIVRAQLAWAGAPPMVER